MSSSVKCIKCHKEVTKGLLGFDITNIIGDHENITLMHCENCDAFFEAFWIDNWFADNNIYRLGRGFTEDEALVVYLFFVSCREYKNCKCSYHQAVTEWASNSRSIFDRHDLMQSIRSNPEYPTWIKDWEEVLAEDRKDKGF